MPTPIFVDYFMSPIRDSAMVQVAITAALILIAMDIIFGGYNAARKGEFQSRVMREGLMHKATECCIVIIGDIMDALVLAGIEIPTPIGDMAVQGLVTLGFCLFILWMEFTSLMEIFAGIYPKLAEMKPFQILASVGNVKIGGTDE